MNGRRIPITAGLIRKARIADDLGWRCPYTGVQLEPKQLVTRAVDKDHIVPRSDRASDSLDSLVITFSAINKWKGRRTAMTRGALENLCDGQQLRIAEGGAEHRQPHRCQP